VERHHFTPREGVERARFEPWLEIADANEACQSPPPRCIARPEFCTPTGSFFGTYGFFISDDSRAQTLFVTALHVMDALIKDAGIDCSSASSGDTSEKLAALPVRVRVYDVLAANWLLAGLGMIGPVLPIPHTWFGDEPPHCQHDIAAFQGACPAPCLPARLAPGNPQVGDRVFAIVPTPSGSAHGATVIESDDDVLIIRFDRSDRLRAASGSPLVNVRGEIVGTNVGRGLFAGRQYGYATHARTIRDHLRLAPWTTRECPPAHVTRTDLAT
jgi:hypothetical protein